MQKLSELANVDRRIDDATEHLREQQAIMATIDCHQPDKAVFLTLLSNVLQQFYRLKFHRRAMVAPRQAHDGAPASAE